MSPTSDPMVVRLHRVPGEHAITSRVYLRATIFNAAADCEYFPQQFDAVIDTGAQVSIVPRRVLEYFGERNINPGPQVRLRAFDGRQSESPAETFRAHFKLTGIAAESSTRAERGFARETVYTRDLWRQPVLCACVAMGAVDDAGGRIEQVILGMDFLSRCDLSIRGPSNVQTLKVHPLDPSSSE